jgi:death-on-curing protein
VRDEGLLLSALAKPINHYKYDGETDAVSLAVTLLFGIARNHPFEQGNKRTAFLAAIDFLDLNGYQLTLVDSPALAKLIVRVLTHKLSEAAFEATLRKSVAPLGPLDAD